MMDYMLILESLRHQVIPRKPPIRKKWWQAYEFASISFLSSLCFKWTLFYFVIKDWSNKARLKSLYYRILYCVFIKVICILMMKELVFIASGESQYYNFSHGQQGQSFKLEKTHKLPFPKVVASRVIYMYLEYKPKQSKFLTKETMLYLRTCIFILMYIYIW